jgi:subtilisin family serine protease
MFIFNLIILYEKNILIKSSYSLTKIAKQFLAVIANKIINHITKKFNIMRFSKNYERLKKMNLFLLIIIAMQLISCNKNLDVATNNQSLIGIDNTNTANAASALSNGNISQDVGNLSNSYIVVFKDQVTNVDDEVSQASKKYGITVGFKYKNAIKGFSAKLPDAALNGLKNNPNVSFIEQDQVMSSNTTQYSVPSWGIDRVDQPSLLLSGSYSYTSDGAGVDAYIFDTGIFLAHNEFGGRATGGYSSIGKTTNWSDQNGHGTHVAGTVGGATYGIAKNIHLIAVRVLGANGSGTTSGVIAGIDWAISNHTTTPAVGNMSLGGGVSTALDNAVNNAISDGIVMCVAAGNNSKDASNYSPARVTNAITVGATGAYPTFSSYDAFASYSNFGSVVDILAPGTYITSAWIGSVTAKNTISGTSMATPHVTGVAGLYLSLNPTASPSTVQSALKSASTLDQISGVPGGTVNSLLFSKY